VTPYGRATAAAGVALSLALGASLLVAGASGASAASGASGAAHGLDMGKARREIASTVRSTYSGIPIGNVACPTQVERRAGRGFVCTVQLPGTFLVIDAKVTDASGAVQVDSPQVVVTKDQLEQFVLRHATLPATVDCGPLAWMALRPLQRVTCDAALLDGARQRVEVAVADRDGTLVVTAVV
jgi:hypothetical protein